MIFSEKTKSRLSDFGAGWKMKDSALVELMENCASHHSDFVHDAAANGSEDGIAQIVTDWTLQIVKRPVLQDEFIAKTWIEKERMAFLIHRQGILEDPQGNPLVYFRGTVALYDTKEGKVIRVPAEKTDLYQPEPKPGIKGKRRLFEKESDAPLQDLPIRKCDVDYNGHVHNTRYLDLAQELITDEEADRISQLQISYLSPLKQGMAKIRRVNTDNGFQIQMYQNESLCTLIDYELTD